MKKDKKALIAQISKNLVPERPAPPPVEEPKPETAEKPQATTSKRRTVRTVGAPESPAAASTGPTPGTGKQAAFWLDDEDRAIFHEMGMHLYSQGIKPSHNLVLRAAIRMIPRDHRLVEKVRELLENDGRKVRHQKKNGG